MKRVKIINVFSLVFNVLIVGAVVWATLLLLEIADLANSILFFTTISNFLVALSALVMIPANIYSIAKGKKLPKAVVTLKQMGTVCMAITLTVVLAVLGPAMGLELPALLGYFDFQNYNFYYHLIVPVLAIVSSLFFDYSKPRKWAVSFISIIPGFLYLAFYIVNVFLEIVPAAIPEIDKVGYDWYEFFSLFEGDLLWTILLFAGMAVGAWLLSFLIWLINNLITKKFARLPGIPASAVVTNNEPEVKEEIEVVEEEKEPEPEPEPAPAPVEEPVEEEKEEEEEKPAPAPKKKATSVKKAEPKAEKEEKKPVVKKAEPKPAEEKKPAPVVKKAEPAKKAEEKKEAPKKAEPAKKEAAPKAEPKAKAAPAKAEPKKAEPASKKAEPAKKPEAKPAPKAEAPAKVYHLTKRKEDGMWAITFVGGQKAVKLFKTKKEAEEHLKVLTENQGATALIRNSKGAKAGKFASSIKANKEGE